MESSTENKLFADSNVWEELWGNLQSSKDFLSETVQETIRTAEGTKLTDTSLPQVVHQHFDALTQASNSAADQITRITQTARTALDEATNQAIESVIKRTNSATAKITQTTEEVTGKLIKASNEALIKIDNLTETTSQVVDHVNSVTDQAVVTVTETAEKAKASLDETLQRAEQLNNSVTNTVQRAVADSITNWLEAHPILAWMFAHPLFTAIIIILLLWFFLGLLNAIAQLSQQIWLVILRSPFEISQQLVGRIAKAISPVTNSVGVKLPRVDRDDGQERFTYVLSRLESIKQEQEQLIEEMQVIVSSFRDELVNR